MYRRSLHWERGLKQYQIIGVPGNRLSLPSLGAWIETTPQYRFEKQGNSRSLHWERGLKLYAGCVLVNIMWSLPSLGAWIETEIIQLTALCNVVAPFIGSVD